MFYILDTKLKVGIAELVKYYKDFFVIIKAKN